MAAPISVPRPGDTIAGRYQIESVLGRGGMGTVFAARHVLSSRKVALKWIVPEEAGGREAFQRFLLEARALGRIDHPNVVGVFDVGTDGDGAYLVMEVLRGDTLRGLLDREGPLSVERALGLLIPAMQGVEAAHRAMVVHRDLKPANIFVVAPRAGVPETVKVLDFGISKVHADADPGLGFDALTRTGQVMGTPHYMAPEQVRGEMVDARVDVWALATILYEAVAGRTPFQADTAISLFLKIVSGSPTPLGEVVEGLPDGFAQVVHRGLAKEPAHRFQTVAAFAEALERWSSGPRFQAPPKRSLPYIVPPDGLFDEERPSPAPSAPAPSASADQATVQNGAAPSWAAPTRPSGPPSGTGVTGLTSLPPLLPANTPSASSRSARGRMGLVAIVTAVVALAGAAAAWALHRAPQDTGAAPVSHGLPTTQPETDLTTTVIPSAAPAVAPPAPPTAPAAAPPPALAPAEPAVAPAVRPGSDRAAQGPRGARAASVTIGPASPEPAAAPTAAPAPAPAPTAAPAASTAPAHPRSGTLRQEEF